MSSPTYTCCLSSSVGRASRLENVRRADSSPIWVQPFLWKKLSQVLCCVVLLCLSFSLSLFLSVWVFMYTNSYFNHACCILCTMSMTCRYDLMMNCWNKSPSKRPRFSELVSEISTSLEGMAGYMELSTEPLTADLTIGEKCVEEESDVEHLLDHETEETECRNKNEYIWR